MQRERRRKGKKEQRTNGDENGSGAGYTLMLHSSMRCLTPLGNGNEKGATDGENGIGGTQLINGPDSCVTASQAPGAPHVQPKRSQSDPLKESPEERKKTTGERYLIPLNQPHPLIKGIRCQRRERKGRGRGPIFLTVGGSKH